MNANLTHFHFRKKKKTTRIPNFKRRSLRLAGHRNHPPTHSTTHGPRRRPPRPGGACSRPASSSAAVAEVNAWLASLAAEAGEPGRQGQGLRRRGGVVGVGGGGAAPELSLGPEPTPRGWPTSARWRPRRRRGPARRGSRPQGWRAQAAEYRAGRRACGGAGRAGLARDALSPPAAVSARAVAAVANLLAIRDTEMSRWRGLGFSVFLLLLLRA